MDEDLSLIGSSTPLEKIDPINQRRLLAFINFFIIKTCEMLNTLARHSEQKIAEIDYKLNKLDDILTLLEQKLSSIEGLSLTTSGGTAEVAETAEQLQSILAEQPKSTDMSNAKPSTVDDNLAEKQDNQLSLRDDPRYSKYFSMLKMGVPMMAVKQKMSMEGFDASILDQSTSIASKPSDDPPPTDINVRMVDGNEGDSCSSESSVASFSDDD